MREKIYDIDRDGAETFRCESLLADCFPDDLDELAAAHAELKVSGRYWCGGGAAELCLLVWLPTTGW